jgi:hypothetical protein
MFLPGDPTLGDEIKEQCPLQHIRIKLRTLCRRLDRRLERAPTRKQRSDIHDLQHRRPRRHAQRTKPVAGITPRVRRKRGVFQRLTRGARGRGVDGVRDERALKAVHGVAHPSLTLRIKHAAVV